jgi:D-tyrosyl-tRNA(Tyr) deacylase
VRQARVLVNDETVGAIAQGLLVYVAAGQHDRQVEVNWMANKLATLRVFADDGGKMSLDVSQSGGAVLLVSQFTLYGDVRRGRRPSFDGAAPPERALHLYEGLRDSLRALGVSVATGQFRAMMKVEATVDGPVTILIDSEKQF